MTTLTSDMAAVRKPKTKRVPQHVLDHYALEVRRVIDERYEGNQTRAAKALDCSQSMLSNILNGIRGPGLNQLMALRHLTGRSIDSLLGLPPTEADGLIAQLMETLRDRAQVDLIVKEAAAKEAEQRALGARAKTKALPPKRKTPEEEEE
jgi:transcriptional regulator with XRE-family HTH domain